MAHVLKAHNTCHPGAIPYRPHHPGATLTPRHFTRFQEFVMSAVRLPTIAAIATAPGRGGIGVIRLSGQDLLPMARALSGGKACPRVAVFTDFPDADGQPLDNGLLLFSRRRIRLPGKT